MGLVRIKENKVNWLGLESETLSGSSVNKILPNIANGFQRGRLSISLWGIFCKNIMIGFVNRHVKSFGLHLWRFTFLFSYGRR